MQNKKRIAHFVHWTRNGITSLTKTISNTNNSDFEFCFILLIKDDNFDNYYSDFTEKTQLNIKGNFIASIYKYRKFIKKNDPLIIHTHSFTPFLIACIFSPFRKKILHLHSEYPYFYESAIKPTIKRLTLKLLCALNKPKIITVTEKSVDIVRKITGNDATYIANGIADTGGKRDFFIDQQSKFKFYSVSRLDAAKKIDNAIQIITGLKNKGIDVTYDVYGDGVKKDYLEKMIIDNNAENYISMKGFNSSPAELPKDYDFYLTTTLQEGLSLSALDALRGQTPLITTAVGQIGKILEHGKTGFIIENNVDENIRTIEKILKLSSIELTTIQKNARALYQNNFTQNLFIKNIYATYKSCVSNTEQ